jgi:catalase (peroxidase I)
MKNKSLFLLAPDAAPGIPPVAATQLPTIDIAALKQSIIAAEAVAAQLVADKYHGASQFVAGLRGQLATAVTFVTEHEQWIAANPPKPVATPVTAPAAAAPGK